jgi:predicted Zn-dependent protease
MYKIAIKSAKEIDDIKNIFHYAQKIYDYQKRTKSALFSPWVELELANVLMKTKKYSKAINILQELAQNKKLSKKDRARVLYELSTTLDNKGYFALSKRVLQECVKIKTKSTYKKLCKDGLKIYQ